MKHRLFLSVVVCLFIGVFGRSAAKGDFTSVTVSADTTLLNAGDADNNAGGHPTVLAGRAGNGTLRRGLFQFDVSALPAGSTVTSATFRLSVVGVPAFGSANSTFDLRQVLADWEEGNKSGNHGAAAGAGETTWNSRYHNTSLWVSAGGDFAAVPAASTFVTGAGAYTWSDPGLVTTVQNWLDNPATNFGVLLITQSEGVDRTARQFGSSEGGSPAILDIGFELPPLPDPPEVVLTNIFLKGGTNLTLQFTGDSNLLYDLALFRPGQDPALQIQWPNRPDGGTGTNELDDLPLLASPRNPLGSENLQYVIQGRTVTQQALAIDLTAVASNLVSPVTAVHADDGSHRLFIVEQPGRILVLSSNKTLLPEPFLDISDKMTNLAQIGIGGITNNGLNPVFDERGLLGLAFHPGYETNGRFFVYYSSPFEDAGVNHESIIAEYGVSLGDPNLADTNETVILRQHQPQFNHNAGALLFGDDGYLYASFGDGGGAHDAHGTIGNGQDRTNLLGSIIRINVDGGAPYTVPGDNPFVGDTNSLPEIYAFGFRNPFRMSFDRMGTNRLIVADVGQDVYEEVSLVGKGENHGWRIAEGLHAFDPELAKQLGVNVEADLSFPIHEYSQDEGGLSVIGGFFYRGGNYPELNGRYVFGDFSASFGAPEGRLYYLDETRSNIWERFEFDTPALGRYVKGFGEDEAGELYLLTTTNLGPTGTSGEVFLMEKP